MTSVLYMHVKRTIYIELLTSSFAVEYIRVQFRLPCSIFCISGIELIVNIFNVFYIHNVDSVVFGCV